ncbi:MAG: PilT/PilU family type 4a pilus ATPase [Lachnospiraceae bacterium]|nr:PilT/PilU family type 4a pilus ATPase [Lachnospiraceae bacterium]
MDVKQILEKAVKKGASDVFIVAGRPICLKINGRLEHEDTDPLKPCGINAFVEEIYQLSNQRNMTNLIETGDDDFAVAIAGLSRFRVNIYKQRGSFAAVIRIIRFDIPDPNELGIPGHIIELGNQNNGMILVTGPAGSGKSTTLACIIDAINQTRESHIITLEDPLEYLHHHQKSVVSQREVYIDTKSYVTALKASLRQSPDVILLGEMRDLDTIEVAMTAAETGHLIFSTLHTIGAVSTIERIIDVFPSGQQRQIALQLTMVLKTVVSQQLVPTLDGHLTPVFEVMRVTPAIRTMIRDGKVHQITGVMQTAGGENMMCMDDSLLRLFKEGQISKDVAIGHAVNPELLQKKLGQS